MIKSTLDQGRWRRTHTDCMCKSPEHYTPLHLTNPDATAGITYINTPSNTL